MNDARTRPGLRDRKRAQTWTRIETAAVELVLRDGLDATTVDAISERADISPRTFFNYFESKDAAVLGVRPHQADEEVLAEHLGIVDDLEPVVAVVHLVMVAMGVVESADAGLHRSRLEILRRHPEIVGGQFAQLNARKVRLAEYVTRILAGRLPVPENSDGETGRDAGSHTEPGSDARAHGDIVLAMCASAVRSALISWARSGESRRPTPRGMGNDDIEVIEHHAVELVASTLEQLENLERLA